MTLKDQEVGKPHLCDHLFCFICLSEWAKEVNTCPFDRKEFHKIDVFANINSKNILRTVTVAEATKSVEDFVEEEDFTYCEICNQRDREDEMLLCDACDLGYHMNCLSNPITSIPRGNWYCDNCFSSGEESENDDVANEVDFLNTDIQENGGASSSRLRNRLLQSNTTVSATRQSSRISARNQVNESSEEEEPQPIPGPSTKARTTTTVKRKYKKRRRTRKRKYKLVVTEYDVDSDDKFAMKTRKIRRRIRKRRRKQARKSNSNNDSAFRNMSSIKNSNAFDLQYSRMSAGITNFNIFEPANLLDYVPDEENEDPDIYSDAGGRGDTLLARSTALRSIGNNLTRKQIHLKNRVDRNLPAATSVNLLDSIMQQQELMLTKNSFQKNFKVDKDGKVTCKNATASKKDEAGGPSDGGDSNTNRNNSNSTSFNWKNQNTGRNTQGQGMNQSFGGFGNNISSNSGENRRYSGATDSSTNYQSTSFLPTYTNKNFQKPKDDDEEDKKSEMEESCPNFSIYSAESIDFAKDPESSQTSVKETPKLYAEDDVDLVQEDGDEAEIYNPESPTNFDSEETQTENEKPLKSPEVENAPEEFQLVKSPQTFDNPASPEPEEIDDSVLRGSKVCKPISMEFTKKNKSLQKGVLDMFDDSEDSQAKMTDENLQENEKEIGDKCEESGNEQADNRIDEIKSRERTPESDNNSVETRTPLVPRHLESENLMSGSYTPPPPIQEKTNKKQESNNNSKKEKKEIERYDVRKRLRTRDEFGRNRSRSKHRSNSRSLSPANKKSRKRSSSSVSSYENRKSGKNRRGRSPTPQKSKKNKSKKIRTPSRSRRSRSAVRRRRSRSHSRSFSFSISPSRSLSRNISNKVPRKNRGRTPSPLPKYRNRSKSKKKSKSKEKRIKKQQKDKRKSRTRTPPLPASRKRVQTPSPPKKFSGYSDNQKNQKKSKKKKNEKTSKHQRNTIPAPTTNTKEIFTSGENILVSVNFNNRQMNERVPTTPPIHRRTPNKDLNLEPKEVVDITTKKKLDSVVPVAIIDLDQSPFKIVTPEHNVIELSDSDNEKQIKSPDSHESNKLYDPFEVLASPTDNVTSSYETFGNDVTTTASQQQANQQQSHAAQTKDDKMNDQSIISIFNSTATSIPCISASSGDENIDIDNMVTSSSANKPMEPAIIESVQSISQNSPYIEYDGDMGGLDSPYSPGSADLHWFPDVSATEEESKKKGKKSAGATSKNDKTNTFDVLFGSTSPPQASGKRKNKGQKGLWTISFC